MSERLQIQSVEVLDLQRNGDLFEVDTEDGPVVRAPRGFGIRAKLDDGSRYWHQVQFPDTEIGLLRAQRLASRVSRLGSIDLDFWVETYPEYGSASYFDEVDLANSCLRQGLHEELRGHRLGSLV